ncbi:hypothetical protein GGR58DRAFT_268391 [Xylaria digitata]|nr:hypothetical protein GGR58DRAFT_268391 [Xylaria digitata]
MLVYAIQHRADVYCANKYGVTASKLAYAEESCYDIERDTGSYRVDLWDAVLHACGYNISEFRTACPRRARYTELYTRKDFELLWKDREHLCPYWEDNEWPMAPNSDRVIDPSTSRELLYFKYVSQIPDLLSAMTHLTFIVAEILRGSCYRVTKIYNTFDSDDSGGEGNQAR